MIKAQEKRDLDPALLAIPTFLGEPAERSQCLDWISRVRNVYYQSGLSFRQELINKSGILVQNFIRSLNAQLMNNDLTMKILQFFSDVPTTSDALNKLWLIKQGSEEPIVNYNQHYKNLVERVESCELNSICQGLTNLTKLVKVHGKDQSLDRNAYFYCFSQICVLLLYV